VRFKAKKIFFFVVILLLFFRILEFILMPLFMLFPVDDAWICVVLTLNVSCALLFVDSYATVLIFWTEFYWHMSQMVSGYATLTPLKPRRMNLILIGFQAATALGIIVAFVVFLVLALNESEDAIALADDIFGFIIACQMLLLGLYFSFIGVRLFQVLRGPLASTVAGSPTLYRRSFQIVALASTCTVLFILRAFLIFLPSAIVGLLEKDGDIQSIQVPWWYFLFYYVLCELLPISIMTYFSAVKKRPSSTLLVEEENLAEDEGDHLLKDRESPVFRFSANVNE